ncbi:hypothetical protein [Streptomyces sp. NPDC002845]
MAAGGFCKLPNGSVVVALNLPSPAEPTPGSGSGSGGPGSAPGSVRVLVHAQNRARALTRLRNLGMRAVYLRGNAAPPTPDEVTAVLHHPDGLIWRTAPDNGLPATELWHPIRALLRRPAAPQGL